MFFTHREVSGGEVLPLLQKATLNAAGGPPVSATVVTLALLVESQEASPWTALAEELAVTHPARIIVIRPSSPAESSRMDVKVGATVTPRPNQPPLLYSEYLELVLSGSLAMHWIDLVQPLVRSNLPAYLWWLSGPPAKDFRWDLLQGAFSQFVLDSGQHPLADWRITLWRAMDVGIRVNDLQWIRLLPWRRMLADAGDHPLGADALFTPRSIAMRWPHERLGEGLLLVGWLAERLKWIPDPHRHRFERPDGGTVDLVWHEGPVPGLAFSQNDLSLDIGPHDASLRVQVHQSGQTVWSLDHPLSQTDHRTTLLQLLSQGHDTNYEGALTWALAALNRPFG